MQYAIIVCMQARIVVQLIRARMVELGETGLGISQKSGIPQSTISRSLRNPKRVTKTHYKLCTFMHIELPSSSTVDSIGRTELHRALDELWDGSAARAQDLTRLLRAVASLEANSPKQSSPDARV